MRFAVSRGTSIGENKFLGWLARREGSGEKNSPARNRAARERDACSRLSARIYSFFLSHVFFPSLFLPEKLKIGEAEGRAVVTFGALLRDDRRTGALSSGDLSRGSGRAFPSLISRMGNLRAVVLSFPRRIANTRRRLSTVTVLIIFMQIKRHASFTSRG